MQPARHGPVTRSPPGDARPSPASAGPLRGASYGTPGCESPRSRMILPFPPWEQKKTLRCQHQHHSMLQPLSQRWISAVVKSAALQGSSLTAKLPTDLGHRPQHSPVQGTVLPGPWGGPGCCDPARGGQRLVSCIPQDGTRSQAGPRGQRVGDLPPGWGSPRWAPASQHPSPQPISCLLLFNGYEGNFTK